MVKSWRCQKCGREEWFSKPKDRHFSRGFKCEGIWEEFNWRRQIKPIVHNK